MDPKLKENIMQAFAEGLSPVGAVIRFEIVPDVIAELYEEYAKSQGGFVIWGGDVKKLEKTMGIAPGTFTPDALLTFLIELKAEETNIASEVVQHLARHGWHLVDKMEGGRSKFKKAGEVAELRNICPKHFVTGCIKCMLQ